MATNKLAFCLRNILIFLPALFPLYFLRFDVGPAPFSLLEVLVWVCFAMWLFLFVRTYKAKLQFSYIFRPFVLLCGITLISVLFLPRSVEFEGQIYAPILRGLGIWKEWILAPTAYVFLFVRVVLDAADQTNARRAFLWGAAGLALVSLLWGGFAEDGRLVGFFDSPNYLALYLTPALVLAFGEVWSERGRIFYEALVWVAMMLPALILTRSYSAFVVLGLVGLIWIIKDLKGKLRWSLFLILTIGLGLLVGLEWGSEKFLAVRGLMSDLWIALSTWDFNNLYETVIGLESSVAVRVQIWQVAWSLFLAAPFLGIGLGYFQLAYWQNAWVVLGGAPLSWNILHTHNLYLQWLTETGVLGLMAFLWFLWVLMTKYPVLVGKREHRWAVLAILLYGFFDLPFWKNDLAWEFFFLVAIIVSGNYIIRGRVMRGKSWGRDHLKLPTINLEESLGKSLNGVYAVYVYWREQRFKGVLFAGKSLTYPDHPRTLEAHILDVNVNLYGEDVRLEVVSKLRDFKKFALNKELAAQVKKDCEQVRKTL